MMKGTILAAGLDIRELRLEVRFLERDPGLVQEASNAEELLETLVRGPARLVVLGMKLPDLTLEETIKRIRQGPATGRVSVLVLIPASEPVGTEGVVLGAGANAALRRPLDRFVLESWLAKLLDVPQRVQTRLPVHVQVVGTPRRTPNGHFYGLTRNLSVHGMLLASPVKIDSEDLDLEIDLPEPEGRIRVLARVVREAPDVGWPYIGYGIEFLFLPEAGQRAIERMVERENPPEVRRPLWAPDAIHSTMRRDEWIYELTDPLRYEGGFLVEIRRAPRGEWRPGGSSPFYVVQGPTAEAALDAARAFVSEHG
jgi:CheY-like chemotaxis protein